MKKVLTTTAAAAAIFGLGGSTLAHADGSSASGRGKDGRRTDCASSDGNRRHLAVFGLTQDNRLICFSEHRPDRARTVGTITGLQGDTSLVGIDVRPANGELFGLGNAGGLYVVDPTTAVATKRSQLSVALSGTSFGVDFNPTVDRLRIISDAGQNLRVNVDTGAATVDGTLTYTAPPAAPIAATGVVGAAYTNNDADPNTATTLYDIDSALDQVAIQAPPNNGILNPTGKLGVDTTALVGSDIYSTIRGGTTVEVEGYASLTVGGRSAFYEVDLATGRASLEGAFAPHDQVIGIAIPLAQR